MKTLLNTIFYVISVQCSISTGYLYSNYMKSFICQAESKSIKGSRPVLFTIQTQRNKNEKYNSGFNATLVKVLSVDNTYSNRLFMSILPSGMVKLLKGNKCETAHNNAITPQKCNHTNKQEFVWVPESMFGEFVNRINKKSYKTHNSFNKRDYYNYNEDKYAKKSDLYTLKNDRYAKKKDKYAIKEEKHKLNELTSMMSDIKNAIGTKMENKKIDERIEKKLDEKLKEKCEEFKRPSLKDDNIFKKYLNYYTNNSPVMQLNNQSRIIPSRSNNMCVNAINDQCNKIQGMMRNSINILDDDYMKSIDTLIKDIGIPGLFNNAGYNYVSQEERPRNRGIFAKGEDSIDGKAPDCSCKFECIRNPKNGLCFYRANIEGKLIPILKDSSCCKASKKDLCNYSNMIDRHLCELITVNDYGMFSKFLDQNYSQA